MNALTWTAWGSALVVAAGIGLVAFGGWRWASATQSQMAKLEAARLPMPATRYDARELEGLPAPVQRYFRAVLKDGQPIIATASFSFEGTFNMSATGEQWKPFTSS